MNNDKFWRIKMDASMNEAKKNFDRTVEDIETLVNYGQSAVNLLLFPFKEELWGSSIGTVKVLPSAFPYQACYYEGRRFNSHQDYFNFLSGSTGDNYTDFLVYFWCHELLDDGEPHLTFTTRFYTFYLWDDVNPNKNNKKIDLPSVAEAKKLYKGRDEGLTSYGLALSYNDIEVARQTNRLGKLETSILSFCPSNVNNNYSQASHYINETHIDALLSNATYKAYKEFALGRKELASFIKHFSAAWRGEAGLKDQEEARKALGRLQSKFLAHILQSEFDFIDSIRFHHFYSLMKDDSCYLPQLVVLIEAAINDPERNFDIEFDHLAIEFFFEKLYGGHDYVNPNYHHNDDLVWEIINDAELDRGKDGLITNGYHSYRSLFRRLLMNAAIPEQVFFTFTFKEQHFVAKGLHPLDKEMFWLDKIESEGKLAVRRLMLEASHYKLSSLFSLIKSGE